MHVRLISALLCALLVSQGSTAQSDLHWVATWGTSPLLAVETPPAWIQPPPADTMPANPPPSPILPYPAQFADQTVRMVVRTSIGGERIRLQFANTHGAPVVHLGAVHVAVHTSHGAIGAGTDQVVTFGGSPEVSLNTGALVVSDPVELAVSALGELVVSVYLPDEASTLSRHELGLNTTYITSGNTVAAPDISASEINRSYFWLSGIEVMAPAAAGSIITFGDSITDGFSTTPDRHQAWPALLAARLQDNATTRHLGIVNAGISGNRILRNIAGASALTRFDRDVLARSGVQWLILLEGINDITFTALPGAPVEEQASTDTIIAGLSQLVDRAHAHGIKVMGATLTPMEGLWLFNPKTEAMRQAVNSWIRSSGKFDALVDFDAATRDPAQPDRLRPDFNSGDNIHPNDAGNAAMAALIDISNFTRQDRGSR